MRKFGGFQTHFFCLLVFYFFNVLVDYVLNDFIFGQQLDGVVTCEPFFNFHKHTSFIPIL